MNYKAWEKLYEDSCQLTKPAHAKQLLPEEDVADIHLLIRGIIQIFLEKGNVHLGLKIYLNNELRNDMTERMLTNPPSSDVSLESWSKHIFGKDKFGMILNSLEEYSNPFSEKAATMVSPLLEVAGLPLGGLSFLCFMGNYGFTPFGVHKESAGEEGILFHLGPGNKQFYTWDNPKNNAIMHNTKVFHDFNKMLPDARCFELKPGDAMFIPHQVYHIANTGEFSLSFVMDYINPPSDRLENQLAKAVGEEENFHKNTYLQPLKVERPVSEWNQVLDHQSIQQKIEVAFRRKIILLKSNGGILKKSKPIREAMIPNGSFSIKSKRTFPLYYEEQIDDRILIFARGHRVNKKNHPRLTELIKQLNSGASIWIESFREILEPLWELSDIFSLIADLLQIEAITIDNTKKENIR